MQPVLVDGVECALDGRIAGLDRDRLAKPGRALQPEPADLAKAAAIVPDAAEFGPGSPTAPRTNPRRRSATPSAASEVAGVGVPSGAATTLVPIPTTTASRSPATASASSRMPASFCRPASTSFGHFSENFISSDPADLSDASMLTFAAPPRARARRQSPSVAATAGATSTTSRTLLARLPRGAIQGRCRRPRPAVCSDGHKPDRPALARRAHATSPPHWSSRPGRKRRAGSPPIWPVDRARMPSRTATSPRPWPRSPAAPDRRRTRC